jgi:hypothetical protein
MNDKQQALLDAARAVLAQHIGASQSLSDLQAAVWAIHDETPRRYVYFVSYVYSEERPGGTSTGTGRTDIIKRRKITQMADIIEIETLLRERQKFSNLVVTNYQLMREDMVQSE